MRLVLCLPMLLVVNLAEAVAINGGVYCSCLF